MDGMKKGFGVHGSQDQAICSEAECSSIAGEKFRDSPTIDPRGKTVSSSASKSRTVFPVLGPV